LCICLGFFSPDERCDWSTVFYLKKGSKTPEATSDLARKNDKKTKRSTPPAAAGAAIVQGGGRRVDAHTHTHTSGNVGDEIKQEQ
jgi:hypothetical protein